MERQEPDRIKLCDDRPDSQASSRIMEGSELDFAHIMNAVGQGVLVMGEEWRFEYSNPAFARMAGKSLEDLVGKTMNDFIIPEDLPLLAQERLKLLAGQTTACELRLRRSGGEIVHIHATGVPRFHGKRVVGSMSVIADITERKQAEETLRISHQILDGIINAIPVRVFWKDRDLVYLGCNTIFARDAGFTDPKDIIGKDDYQMGWRNQAELYRADDRYVIESGRPKLLIEEPQTTPDGNTIVLLTSKIPLRSSEGEIIGVLGTYMDITKRKRMEIELQESDERFKAQYQGSPAPTFTWQKCGDDFILVDFNKAAKDITNGKVCEFVECKASELYADRQEISRDLLRCHNEGEVIRREIRSQNFVPGALIIATFASVPPDLVLVHLEDITKRKRMEEDLCRSRDELEQRIKERTEELARKNDEMEHFVYTVSHDLRAPLISISGFLGFIEQDALKGDLDRLQADLRIISDAVARMDGLLMDTLELSRIGRVINPPEDVPFSKIIGDALEQTEEKIVSKGVKVSIAPDLPVVHVDRMRIVEVLVNLIDNSIKYMGPQEKPEIEFGLKAEGGEDTLYVRDNGIGIDPGQHEKVFELFYKIDRKSKGTGAGLAIVKRIIEVHGGRIWIESEQGKGCTVCFMLPIII